MAKTPRSKRAGGRGGGMGSIPGEGTRSHMLQVRVCMPLLRPGTTSKYKIKKKKKKNLLATQETQVRALGQEDPSPGAGNGNPLQYSYMEDSMDRGAWWATVHGVTKTVRHN